MANIRYISRSLSLGRGICFCKYSSIELLSSRDFCVLGNQDHIKYPVKNEHSKRKTVRAPKAKFSGRVGYGFSKVPKDHQVLHSRNLDQLSQSKNISFQDLAPEFQEFGNLEQSFREPSESIKTKPYRIKKFNDISKGGRVLHNRNLDHLPQVKNVSFQDPSSEFQEFDNPEQSFMEPSDNIRSNSNIISKKFHRKNVQSVNKIKYNVPRKAIKDSADEFGTLYKTPKYYRSEALAQADQSEVNHDDGDADDTVKIYKNPEDWISEKKYSDNMKKLIKEGKLKDALKLYEENFLKEGKLKPSPYTFSVLINGCASVGYTKKAFSLFKKMRDRGMKPTPATITGLFVACSNSPYKENGLEKAEQLREKIKVNGWPLNTVHYHAMIKAFGKCGDIETAFQIADEMVKEGLTLRTETFNFLLTACISNSSCGLRYAIQVWRKMREKNICPDIYGYNLLLRVIKECNIGDLDAASKVILGSTAPKPNTQKQETDDPTGSVDQSNHVTVTSQRTSGQLISNEVMLNDIPDVLSPWASSSAVFSLKEMTKPEERLALFGGMPGLLSQMVRDKVVPNIKTFSQLLDVIPENSTSEEYLLQALEDHKIIPDIDFCNMLIKRRAFRQDDEEATAVIDIMQRYGLSPNIMTFGVMALLCRTKAKADKLLADMDNAGYQLNIEILGTLLNGACQRRDFDHIISLMLRIKQEKLGTNPQILHHFENIISKIESDKSFNTDNKKYNKFKSWYKSWLRTTPLDLPQHPWKQYNYKFDKVNESDENL